MIMNISLHQPSVIAALTVIGLLLVCGDARAAFDPDRYQPLTSDRRAIRSGDLLTVIVLESTRASSRASTDSSSDTDIAIQARHNASRNDYGATLSGDARGVGGTQRAGDVRAQIAVMVTAEREDGTLEVSGEQVLTVNGEAQTIRLQGLVRATDVSADNTVLSNRIGNARIEFTGQGVVSDAQRQSVMFKIFKWLRLI